MLFSFFIKPNKLLNYNNKNKFTTFYFMITMIDHNFNILLTFSSSSSPQFAKKGNSENYLIDDKELTKFLLTNNKDELEFNIFDKKKKVQLKEEELNEIIDLAARANSAYQNDYQ